METKSRKAAAGSQTKATGIVRKVDELGRIVLPIELRRTLEINEKDDLEIYVEGGRRVCFAMAPKTLSHIKEKIFVPVV